MLLIHSMKNQKVKKKLSSFSFKNNIYFILLTLIMSINNSCAQENQLNKNGLKQGIWKEMIIDNPNIEYVLITYNNGEKEGELKSFYRNGKLATHAFYKNNRLNGVLKNYYDDGKLKLLFNYSHGMKNGVFEEYYENKILKTKKVYIEDVLNFYEEYYDNGNIHIKVNNKKENKNDKLEEWEIYHKNGKLMLQGKKKSDKNIGIWKEYSKEGELIKNIKY